MTIASRTTATLAMLLALTWAPSGIAGATMTVHIAGASYLGDLPTLVADKEGLFTRHGLDAEISYAHSGRDNLALLRAGKADFALMPLTPLVLDRLTRPGPSGPDDPVILASLVHSTALNQVVVLADSGIEAPEQLEGRRVLLEQRTDAEFVWSIFALYHGIDPESVALQALPADEIASALTEDRADAAVLQEPLTSRLEQRLGTHLRRFPGSNAYAAKWLLVTKRRTATQNPTRCQALLGAYRDAIKLIDHQPDKAIALYSARFDVEPALLRRHWQALDYQLGLDWSLIAALQQQIDWARRTGRAEQACALHVLALIESAPLRSVAPGAVSIPAYPARSESAP